MNINTNIGLDTIRLYFEGNLKEQAISEGILSYDTSTSEARNRLVFNTNKGKSINCSGIRHKENKLIQVNFHSGTFTVQTSIPKLQKKPFELLDSKANKEVFEQLLEHSSEFADFDPKQVKVSRVDLTRNMEMNNAFYEYIPLIDNIPRTKGYHLQSTYSQFNKSFAHCIYDKVQETLDKKIIMPEQFKNKNIARNEVRLLKGAKLETDSKKIGLDLKDLETYTDQDNFAQVQDLYLLYQKSLFKHSYKAVKQEYTEAINSIKQAVSVNMKPKDFLMLNSSVLKVLTLEQFAKYYTLNSKYSKQYKYYFIKQFTAQYELFKSGSNMDHKIILFSDLLQELKDKSLAKVA
jgi:hypothetical protein